MRGNHTPAERFLNRGIQLIRLQGRIVSHMLEQAESEQFDPVSMDTAAADFGRIDERTRDVTLALQLFISRHVDNFQTFIDDTIRCILTTQPDLLKRSDTVPMTEVMLHDTMESFVRAAIERKIHGLGYKSLLDLQKTIKKEIKFDLFPDKKIASQTELLFDIRNLITHNSGEVNERFLSRHPAPPFQSASYIRYLQMN